MDNKNSTKKLPPYLQNAQNNQANKTVSWGQNLKKYDLAKIEQKKAELPANQSKGAPKAIAVKQLSSEGVNEQKKDCPFCHAEDDSFFLFPTRYAIAKKADTQAVSLPAHLNSYVGDKTIAYSKYTLKYLNTGYLYAFVEYENGATRWLGYRVNEEGFLAKLKNIFDPNCAPTPYGCTNEKHFANSSMICLAPFQKSKAKTAYLLFSKGFLTQARLKLYQANRVSYANEKKWQKIDLTAWRGGQKSNFCYNQQIFDRHVPTPNFAKFGKANQTRKQKISGKFAQFPKAVCGVAIYDALGIAIDLNERRNDQFIELTKFMNTYKDGISNQQRFNSIPLIESIEEGLKRKALQSAKNWAEHTKNVDMKSIDAQLNQSYSERNFQMHQQNLEQMKRKNPEQYKFTEKARKDYFAQYGMTPPSSAKQAYEQQKEIAQQKAKALEKAKIQSNTAFAMNQWENKYKPLVKYDEMQTFKSNVATQTKTGMDNANVVGADHLIWLKSSQLVQELHAFDPEDKISGFVFYEYMMQAVAGTGVTKAGATQMDGWITKRKVESDNVFMRAVLYNQKSAIDYYNEGTQSFFASVVNYTDWTTGQSTYKQLIVTIAALDAAWDEWASNNANKHYMPDFDKTFVGRVGRWSAEFIRVAAQKARSTSLDRLIATQICCFLYARTGVFSKGVNLHSLMLFATPGLDPQRRDPKVSNATLDSILNDNKNKGTARVASFVMVLEAINLMFQLNKTIDFQQQLQILGGACGLITASLELVGVITVTTKTATHNLIKFAANSFAIAGSAFFSLYDLRAAMSSNDSFLAVVYFVRGGVYFGLALSYTKISIDFLQSAGNALKRPALISFSKLLVKSNFYLMITRIGSVVWLARFNIIILGLTAVEIIYKVYFADNALEDWCKKSAFGINVVNFENEAKELEVFNQAFVEVVGV
ncbi:T6SS effector BTH_I2691 family protein [Acinetobacter beijerinckii]|uniref:T6SS effector BTH_I2691 family protein n=1 Tax=Acinetobacter beijerinckii TaxID=262668 RepID=UPI002407665D|nr:T6SS effector BTH_I2691 family protein [Acinetobacter beijerinckii]